MDIWIFGRGRGYSGTSDLNLGKKVGNLDFWDGGRGVFLNFGFGLRKKSWKFGFWGGYSGTSDLDLGKKLEIWILGGYSGTSDLDLGKKVGNLDFWDWGVFWNFGFGLRKKKIGNLDWGGILELRIWT